MARRYDEDDEDDDIPRKPIKPLPKKIPTKKDIEEEDEEEDEDDEEDEESPPELDEDDDLPPQQKKPVPTVPHSPAPMGEQNLIVLKELPMDVVRVGKLNDGRTATFITTEEAIKEILLLLRQIAKGKPTQKAD